MTDIYIADITRCYESIPLDGPDNLLDAITFITKAAYSQIASKHPRSVVSLWVWVARDGSPATTKWATNSPTSGIWFPLSIERLFNLQSWLLRNCHIILDDRVWTQRIGIPMGLSYSPIWCNMYLVAYETQFIQRLARLGRHDLMEKFRFAFRYIDDLCLVNTSTPRLFLSPTQDRTEHNPYWIYPLGILEIKEETTSFSESSHTKRIAANFINIQITINETDPGRYLLYKYDKRRKLPFQYI